MVDDASSVLRFYFVRVTVMILARSDYCEIEEIELINKVRCCLHYITPCATNHMRPLWLVTCARAFAGG